MVTFDGDLGLGATSIRIFSLSSRDSYPGADRVGQIRGGSLRCSLRCSSPASSTVHGGTRRPVTCTGGRRWTCGNAEQRTLNPQIRVWSICLTVPRLCDRAPILSPKCSSAEIVGPFDGDRPSCERPDNNRRSPEPRDVQAGEVCVGAVWETVGRRNRRRIPRPPGGARPGWRVDGCGNDRRLSARRNSESGTSAGRRMSYHAQRRRPEPPRWDLHNAVDVMDVMVGMGEVRVGAGAASLHPASTRTACRRPSM
jgi:hypothetical protein